MNEILKEVEGDKQEPENSESKDQIEYHIKEVLVKNTSN